MKIKILSIFPELFQPFFEHGLLSRAREQGLLDCELLHLRNFALNAYGQIDDSPYGGGSGMVLRPECAEAAIKAAKEKLPQAKVIALSPRGRPFTQKLAHELSEQGQKDGLIYLCSRYEGVDQRVLDNLVDEQVSLGDYVLMGGEVAAMALIEASVRLLPGVLGNPESLVQESFESGLLEYPQYTKPPEWAGKEVPPVLLSGHHAQISAWRKKQSETDTVRVRPDLINNLKRLPACELNAALIHYPVVNKGGEIVISSVTNMDLHDIARSSRTFGISNYYVVHPTRVLRRLCEKICSHWDTGFGATYNANRSEAIRGIKILPDFEDVLGDIEARHGRLPKIIVTSARPHPQNISFLDLKRELYLSSEPHLILFGTAWGLAPAILERADYHLEPINGFAGYNHLSVRAAAAIIFDRLLGEH